MNGGLARGHNRPRTSRQPMARAAYETSRCVDQTCRGEPRATRSLEPSSSRWFEPPRGPAPRKPEGAIRSGKPGDEGCAIAAREGGARAAHLLSMEGALGREKPRRVTTVGWKRSWRASPNREKSAHREKARTGIEQGLRQGRQRYDRRARGFGRTPPHVARAIRRSDAERRETLSSPVSVGGIPSSARLTKSR